MSDVSDTNSDRPVLSVPLKTFVICAICSLLFGCVASVCSTFFATLMKMFLRLLVFCLLAYVLWSCSVLSSLGHVDILCWKTYIFLANAQKVQTWQIWLPELQLLSCLRMFTLCQCRVRLNINMEIPPTVHAANSKICLWFKCTHRGCQTCNVLCIEQLIFMIYQYGFGQWPLPKSS